MRSPYTRNHTFLVTEISKQITLETLSEEDSRLIEISALLHDIGKLKIPLGILHKKGPLNDKEMLIMKSHVVETYKMLVRSGLQISLIYQPHIMKGSTVVVIPWELAENNLHFIQESCR